MHAHLGHPDGRGANARRMAIALAIRESVERVLYDRFGITHTTLQTTPERLLAIEDRRPAAGEPE